MIKAGRIKHRQKKQVPSPGTCLPNLLFYDISSFRAFIALNNFIIHNITFNKALKAVALYLGIMSKNIGTAIVLSYELISRILI
jgi:hypothetical protein